MRGAKFLHVPRRDELLRASAGLAVAAGVALGAVLLVQQVVSQDPAAPTAVVARAEMPPVQPVADESDDAAVPYVTPPAADVPAGIPPAELANYLVAHYGYASPLVRRSVGAGLISDDESAFVEPALPAETADP